MDQALRDYIVSHRRVEIDSETEDGRYYDFIRYLDDQHPFEDQYYRYCMTFSLMLKAGFVAGGSILETGHPSPIARFLEAATGSNVRSSHTDLRYLIDAEDNSLDTVLSFEVMEHIKDQCEQSFDEVVLFNESGVSKFASEIARVLKPGGSLYLTTPNPTSYYVLTQLLSGLPPALYRPHVREYTANEIKRIFSLLTPVFYTTHYSIFHHSSSLRADELRRLFTDLGYSENDRGDLHFFRFIKK